MRIPVFLPHIGIETAKAAVDALELGWLGMGSYVGEFETRLAEYLELRGRQVVAVNTGTSALHLAMLVAGVRPGDEVLTPSFNNIGDIQAIKAAGAEPVFCDIDERTLGIDVEKAEPLVSPRTKAVIGMDYDGIPCALEALEAMAERHGIVVIHDAAHSLGTRVNGRTMGNFGDITVFSFDPVKLITCIDGGALVVDSEEKVAALHRYRLLGMDQSAERMYANNRAWTYDVADQGFRYHLANLHAAIGLTQLARIDEFIASRVRACRHYNTVLADVEGVITPQTNFDDVAPFLYYIRVLDGHRDALIDALKAAGVDTGIHWIPGHRFTFMQNARRGDLSVTNRVGSEILTLPLHSFMDLETVDQVATAVRVALPALRRSAAA